MIALLLLWAAAPVDGARVVVVPAGVSVDDVARADAAAAALQARGMQPVDRDARAGLDGVDAVVVAGDRDRARGLLQEARARFRDLDFDAADERARAAWTEALRLERPEDQRDLLADVLLLHATVRLSVDKDDDEATTLLRLAARVEPSRTGLDPGLHRPTIVTAFAAAREQNLAAKTALVVVAPRVIGSDARAEVVVDGVGRVPAGGLLSLAEGPHLLSLRAPGVAGRSRVLVVKNGGSEAVSDILAPADIAFRRKDAAARIRAGDDAAFAVLARLVGADVVVALASGGRPRVGSGADIKDVKADVDDAVAFAAAVYAAFDAVVLPPVVVEPEFDVGPWLLTGGLGALVVGAGVIVWQTFPAPDGPDIDYSPVIVRPVVITCCKL